MIGRWIRRLRGEPPADSVPEDRARGRGIVVAILSLAACAGTSPRREQRPPGTRPLASKPLSGVCAGLSLLVVGVARTKTTPGVGDDPVETERFALLSRAFLSKLNAAHPELSGQAFKVRRRAKGAVLELVASGPTQAEAARLCAALGSVALAPRNLPSREDDAARSWLAHQRKNVERDKDRADKRLHAFRRQHKLLVVDLPQRIATNRSRLRATMHLKNSLAQGQSRPGLEGVIATLQREALALATLAITYGRLKRQADNSAKLLELVRQRERALQPPERLRLLDRCAPVACI